MICCSQLPLTRSCTLHAAHKASWYSEDGCQKVVAKTQVNHHTLVMVDKGARRPPWQYNWLHITQSVTLPVVPVLLSFGQNTSMAVSLKI